MNKQLFTQYATIKNQITELELQLKELQPQILEELATVDDKQVELDQVGVFSVTHRKTWTYPIEILALQKQVKDVEKSSQADGTATFEEIRGVMFKKNKDENP